MPYENEFANYRPLHRIAEAVRVRALLGRARTLPATTATAAVVPQIAPVGEGTLPDLIVAIDGSYAEVDVKNGYPGAKVGYCTVASVLLNLHEVERLDEQRPVDPVAFRKTEEAATIDAALPVGGGQKPRDSGGLTAFSVPAGFSGEWWAVCW